MYCSPCFQPLEAILADGSGVAMFVIVKLLRPTNYKKGVGLEIVQLYACLESSRSNVADSDQLHYSGLTLSYCCH